MLKGQISAEYRKREGEIYDKIREASDEFSRLSKVGIEERPGSGLSYYIKLSYFTLSNSYIQVACHKGVGVICCLAVLIFKSIIGHFIRKGLPIMVNVILVTYGIMALGALAVAETIVGKDSRIQVVTLLNNEGLEDLESKVRIEFENGIGEDILVMTDIKGGIPWNVCIMLADFYSFTLVAGLNVPMLIEAMFQMDEAVSSADLAEKVCAVGHSSIRVLK